MATLSIPKNYADTTPLFESDIDDIRTAITDFVNVTRLNSDNIQAGGVLRSNIEAVGEQISSSSGSFSTTNTSPTDVTNLSITITTSGRPVYLMLIPDGSGNAASIQTTQSGGDTIAQAQVILDRDGSDIYATNFAIDLSGGTDPDLELPPSAVKFIDTPSAGTYTYKIEVSSVSTGTLTKKFNNVKLAAWELT